MVKHTGAQMLFEFGASYWVHVGLSLLHAATYDLTLMFGSVFSSVAILPLLSAAWEHCFCCFFTDQ